ncbi:MAG: hypothetical protein E1N59_2992 [Puniceicoccaceae bacterium 5H]|nr:MAG: hypothetical protein E1N59_2992 [Puniceicoccaceae bacterium 5H]
MPYDHLWIICRSIPTRVGNTCRSFSSASTNSVHPHAGGEYACWMRSALTCSGPSPRGWGILKGEPHYNDKPRSIPTRVGNTNNSLLCLALISVHPHAGGEYTDGPHIASVRVGPSPRGWGIPGSRQVGPITDRSIPTRVGNTPVPLEKKPSRTVHPHAGGEYASSRVASPRSYGPSPRGWGIQIFFELALLHLRSIPTRVGNTLYEF